MFWGLQAGFFFLGGGVRANRVNPGSLHITASVNKCFFVLYTTLYTVQNCTQVHLFANTRVQARCKYIGIPSRMSSPGNNASGSTREQLVSHNEETIAAALARTEVRNRRDSGTGSVVHTVPANLTPPVVDALNLWDGDTSRLS